MSLWDDLRFAAHALARRPALLAVTMATLTIGIAANAVMFGVVDQLLLRPPAGLQRPADLRRVYFDFPMSRSGPTATTTYPVIAALQRNVPGADVAAYATATQLTLGAGPDARPLQVQPASGNFFTVLGARPVRGRWFGPAEAGVPEGEPVAVVSAGFARRELGGIDEAVGRVLSITGRPFTVIGVAADGFTGVDLARVDVWLPAGAVATPRYGPNWHATPNAWWIQALVRVHAGVDPAVVAQQATAAHRAEARSWNRLPEDTTAVVVLGSIIGARHPGGVSAESKVSLWLLGVSVIVLLIACANVANLLIVRTMERRRELAVRLAFGAGPGRLARLLLLEAAVLVTAGGVAGLLVTLAAGRVVQQLLLPDIAWRAVVDARVLAVTLGAVLASVLLAGLAPAFEGAGTRIAENLKAASHQASIRRGSLRQGLLAVQATLSLVLVIGAGLFVRSLRQVATRDVGVDFDRVLLVGLNLGRGTLQRPQIEELYRAADERVRAMPGIAGVALVRGSVPVRFGSGMSVRRPGATELMRLTGGGPYYSVVPSGYFATIGTTIVRGRAFTSDEDRLPSRSLIVNRVVADAYWPGDDPIGQCAYLGSDTTCSTVVGVTSNAMLFRLIRDDRGLLYLPPGHVAFGGQRPPEGLVVRVAGDPRAVIPTIRKAVQALSPALPFATVEPFAQLVAGQLRPWRLGAAMFTVFGLVALVIAAIGLYSVMACSVSQRTREIGVRMALGAQAWDVVRLVAWQSSRGVVAGLVLGIGIALVASRWVAGMLYETSPRDPAIYAAAALVLAAAAGVASIIPARRSTNVDPVIAIRAD